MTPHFLHILSTGDIWVSTDQNVVPAGTILATYKINASPLLQKIGTLSGNSGAYAVSGANGKNGRDIS
jgi:hypothetical protein